MTNLKEHYSALLGLDSSWRVDEVVLESEASQVLIRLSHRGGELACSCCDEPCSQADVAPERTWRHLDTMQFKTEIKAAIPRSRCSEYGVKTISIPWAGKHSRFTLMFEAFAISVLQCSDYVSRAATLLGLGWETEHGDSHQVIETPKTTCTASQIAPASQQRRLSAAFILSK